jgi:hypothetical protein
LYPLVENAENVDTSWIAFSHNHLNFQYNTKDSDIVKEAKRQTLMRPKLLKEAGE